MPADEPLLRVTGLQKSYSTPVLTDFDFELRRGEVHALVGSNGAGKSTFARILSGLATSDGGQMSLAGASYAPRSKRDAEQTGIIMVLQELNVIPTLTVAENIFLNRLPNRAGWIRSAELREGARRTLARVGLDGLDPATPAGVLGVARQQLVEIAGALSRNCRVLILDEPTAALTDPEIEQLFGNVRQLQAEGVGIIYVSHRMDEIRRIANRITVMRDGRRVATHDTGEVNTNDLVREMAGHDLPARPTGGARVAGEPGLSVRGLSAGNEVREVSFEARCGEIVGIAGLIGSGRTETLRAIFGADAKSAGEIFVQGRPVDIRKPGDAVRAGIGLVPEDRKQHGLLLPLSIRVNLTLATLEAHASHGTWIDDAAERETTSSFCQRLQVRYASIEQPVAELSGGNQQKIVIARWLARDCCVLLFDEPTRGVDAAAKDLVCGLLRQLAAEGKAVVVVSSELAELMALSDRILVMARGRMVAEFLPEEWTQEKITRAAFGGESAQTTSSAHEA